MFYTTLNTTDFQNTAAQSGCFIRLNWKMLPNDPLLTHIGV